MQCVVFEKSGKIPQDVNKTFCRMEIVVREIKESSRKTLYDMKYMLLLISIVIIFACNQKSKHVKEDITEIKPVPEAYSQTEISRLLEDISLIPLKTKDECLTGNVRRIKAYEDCFYLTDYRDTVYSINNDVRQF
jgi:hypothetical protein